MYHLATEPVKMPLVWPQQTTVTGLTWSGLDHRRVSVGSLGDVGGVGGGRTFSQFPDCPSLNQALCTNDAASKGHSPFNLFNLGQIKEVTNRSLTK